MPTSRIWDGEMIKKNIQGNSALYILEDEVIIGIRNGIFCLDKEKDFHENYKKRTVNIEFSEGYNVLG